MVDEVVENAVVEGAGDEAGEEISSTENNTGTQAPGANPPAAKEDPAPGGGASGEEANPQTEKIIGEKTAQGNAPYKPNLKFNASIYNPETKAYDLQEYDINPRFKDFIKTKEDEDLVRELHTKAQGLDSVKERYLETRQAATEIATEHKAVTNQIAELRNVYKSAVEGGNLHKLDRFFDKLQIPQDVIMQYAIEKAKLAELPPEQQNVILGKLKAETQADILAQQQEQFREQLDQQIRQTKQIQLESVMARQDVSLVAEAFDTRMKKVGAFRDAVRQAGEYAWYRSNGKVDLTPDQAIQEVIRSYGLTGGATPGSAPQGEQVGATGAQTGSVERTTKTIPNISGRGGSPLKQKPKSLDDLKALAKQAQ